MPPISGGRYVMNDGIGTLGSPIGDKLPEAGAGETVLFDNPSPGSTENIDPPLADDRCRLVQGDMLRLPFLFRAHAMPSEAGSLQSPGRPAVPPFEKTAII